MSSCQIVIPALSGARREGWPAIRAGLEHRNEATLRTGALAQLSSRPAVFRVTSEDKECVCDKCKERLAVCFECMELHQLRAVVAVVDEQGFTGAAARLRVSQSTVSRAVAGLERDLGVRLLERDPRGQHRLSPIGERVVEHARYVLARMSMLEDIAQQSRSGHGGRLRIGTMPSLGPVLARLAAAHQRRHPGDRVVLLEGKDTEVITWLEEGYVDVATVAENITARNDTQPLGSSGFELIRDTWVAVMRHDHPLAGENGIRLPDLDDDPLLVSDGGCESLLRDLYATAGATFAVIMRIADMTTLLTLIEEGMGVSVIPSLSMRHFPALVAVPLARRFHGGE